MTTDSATWRSIREDFESLPNIDWPFKWSSQPPVGEVIPAQLQKRWTWALPADVSLRARADAIFLKAAKARGYDCAYGWLEELRANGDGAEISEQRSGEVVVMLPPGEAVLSEGAEPGMVEPAAWDADGRPSVER